MVHSALGCGDVTEETLGAFHCRVAMLEPPPEVSGEMEARVRHGQLQSRVVSMIGHLVLTNKKLQFVGSGDGWELAWNKVLDVVPDADRTITLHASQRRGSGRYFVKDAEYVATVIATLTRMAKRQLVGRPDAIDTAVVPQHVKAVFRRDRGRCRECSP